MWFELLYFLLEITTDIVHVCPKRHVYVTYVYIGDSAHFTSLHVEDRRSV
jgi:hypothetical protein